MFTRLFSMIARRAGQAPDWLNTAIPTQFAHRQLTVLSAIRYEPVLTRRTASGFGSPISVLVSILFAVKRTRPAARRTMIAEAVVFWILLPLMSKATSSRGDRPTLHTIMPIVVSRPVPPVTSILFALIVRALLT